MVAANKPNELRLIRVFDAPLDVVWEAWADPEQAAQWMGPRGFTVTHHSKDLRPGGHWAYTMHGPDGTDWPNKTLYHEVEKGAKTAKLVYDHGGNDDRPPLFRVTALFSESDGKTTLDMTMAFESPEAAAEIKQFIKKAGGDGTWDRLAEYLQKQTSGRELFVIARSFAAPIETMFEMWTDPEHVAQWVAPTGFTMKYLRADIRQGGSAFCVMTGNGLTMYSRAEYREIRRPDRIVYTQQFCDEHEKISRHPFAPTWPETMLTTVTLTAEGPDCTRVRIEWEPYGSVTPEELATFIQARGGMTQGWTGSFDKLDEYLKD